MDESSKRWFKLAAGTDWESLTRVPTGAQVVERALRETWSQYPLRDLGWASDGEVTLTEEDRESHIHILGAPGEGKSKLLELLIRQDIDRGYGCCFLDPTPYGETAYKVLKYCIKQGVQKVLLIDPHDFPVVPVINPFHYSAPANVSVGNIMDTIRILWNDKGYEGTARINRYLPAILRALHQSKLTLHEALYFSDKHHPVYKHRRDQILDNLHPLDSSRVILESLFSSHTSKSIFNIEFESTIRRLNPFSDDVMKLIVGSNVEPINFQKMVSDGWVILVNLYPHGVWGDEQQRLLGTLVINEVIYAIHRLKASGWQGIYYLYVDEIGDYATKKLADVLDKERKSGLRFTVAHQRFNQITDENVLSAVKGSTKIKVLFNTQNRHDRDEMMRNMGYGGDLSDRAVSYELSNLSKQHCAIKINKNPPRITRIPDLPDVQVSAKVVQDFKKYLYRQPGYSTKSAILSEIDGRFRQTGNINPQQPSRTGRNESKRPDPKVAGSPAVPDGKPAGKARPRTSKRRPVKTFLTEE